MTNIRLHISLSRSIFLILLLCLCISASAQSDSIPVAAPAPQPVAEAVTFRIPDEQKINEYQNDSRFNYELKERGASLWDKILYEFFNFIDKLFSVAARSGVPGIIVLIVIVAILCFIMLKFLGVDYRAILGKKKMDTAEIDIYTENVHEMDFDTLISNALKNKDYRLTVRFLYLRSLKQLSDKHIIEWKATKTNYSYQYEISNTTLRSGFLDVTLIFDYIWYGEFALDEPKFSEIHSRMNDFTKMIANER